MIEAAVVCDSVSPAGKRITTFRVNAHRFVLAEVNTHRVLSRNWRSSRAVPTERLIREVRDNPATTASSERSPSTRARRSTRRRR